MVAASATRFKKAPSSIKTALLPIGITNQPCTRPDLKSNVTAGGSAAQRSKPTLLTQKRLNRACLQAVSLRVILPLRRCAVWC